MELSVLYFKWLPVKISIKRNISVSEDCFYLIKAKSANPDEMPLHNETGALHEIWLNPTASFGDRGQKFHSPAHNFE